jgi:hypothetical protein
VIALGVRCTKDSLDWAVVDGAQRALASVVEHRKVPVPAGGRGEQLAWVRQEILELLGRHSVEAAAVRVAESGGRSVSLGRSEVEGRRARGAGIGRPAACPARRSDNPWCIRGAQ